MEHINVIHHSDKEYGIWKHWHNCWQSDQQSIQWHIGSTTLRTEPNTCIHVTVIVHSFHFAPLPMQYPQRAPVVTVDGPHICLCCGCYITARLAQGGKAPSHYYLHVCILMCMRMMFGTNNWNVVPCLLKLPLHFPSASNTSAWSHVILQYSSIQPCS